MRLQGGPLQDVGWRCREHLVYVCVQPSGGAVDVPTIARKKPAEKAILFYHHCYLFHEAVTSFMRRLPL